ncbi:rac GTPase-activating protein 1-like isoform X2 [Adelges cooleyi]|uniref:rac GTPase-activating protein 1-like isoform X2 n=1 Tax=Adelges cooleyi TaxID=133065 RepID=UPI00218084EC|nr:rac GTPase-activating protein 1-like isoform X2 [Adelges cooleyi]
MNAQQNSLALKYDIFVDNVQQLLNTSVEKDYIDKLNLIGKLLHRNVLNDDDNIVIKERIKSLQEECRKLYFKLKTSARLLDKACSERDKVEKEKEYLTLQLAKLYNFLNKSSCLEQNVQNGSVVGANPAARKRQHNNTDDLLSGLSYSRTDTSDDGSSYKNAADATNTGSDCFPEKKNLTFNIPFRDYIHKTNSVEGYTVVATTTVTTTNKDSIIAMSEITPKQPTNIIAQPQSESSSVESSSSGNLKWETDDFNSEDANKKTEVNHNFIIKKVVIAEACGQCHKRIKFDSSMIKCKNCKTVAHPKCKSMISAACVLDRKKTNALKSGVPPLIVHCIGEIDSRGLEMLDLYRISGFRKQVKCLKDQFRDGLPELANVDVHVLCCCLKEYIQTQKNQLIPPDDLVKLGEAIRDSQTSNRCVKQIIFELPSVNRTTLAYLILHLQKVAASTKCNIDISSLATVFGSTIIGSSIETMDDFYIKSELSIQVIEELLMLPKSFWTGFINVNDDPTTVEPSTPAPILPQASSRRFFNLSRNVTYK